MQHAVGAPLPPPHGPGIGHVGRPYQAQHPGHPGPPPIPPPPPAPQPPAHGQAPPPGQAPQ
ncbi:hypothetical protein ACWEK7_04315, partial [Streptomyces californicus]